MNSQRLLVVLLVVLAGCKRVPMERRDAAARVPDAAAPPRDVAVVSPAPAPAALILRLPAALPCQHFKHLVFSDRGDIPEDIVEWWPVAGAPLRFDTEDVDPKGEGQTMRLPADFVPRGPVALRFLRHPETASKNLGMTLQCRDAGSIHWECAGGICKTVAIYSVPARSLKDAVPDRYGTRWTCGALCQQPPRELERLFSEPPSDLMRAQGILLQLGRDVALDLADFLVKMCVGGRCSQRALAAEQALRLFLRGARPVLRSATIQVRDSSSNKHEFHAAIAADRYTLTLECEFFPDYMAKIWRKYRYRNVHMECRAGLSEGGEPAVRILSAVLNDSTDSERSVALDEHSALLLMPEDLSWPGATHLSVQGAALHLEEGQPASPPPPVPPPPRQRAVLRTLWPQTISCRQFEKLEVEAVRGITGFQWRGASVQRSFLIADDPQAGKRRSGALNAPSKAQLPVDASLPVGQLEEVVPLLAPSAFLGPKRTRLEIQLVCREPAGSNLGFECAGGACSTWQRRDFPSAKPIGGSYFGPGGWTYCKGDCRKFKAWTALVTANAAQLTGSRRGELLRLGRDLLTEVAQLVETACQGSCAAPALAVATEARALLQEGGLTVAGVDIHQPVHEDPDSVTTSWTARLRAGERLLALNCTRTTENLGMQMTYERQSCSAALTHNGTQICSYSTQQGEGEGKQEPVALDDFTQTLEIPGGSIVVHTGYSYGQRRGDPFDLEEPREIWRPGPVQGSVTISGAALLTRR